MEEGRRSKKRKREVKRHPWAKQGKQDTKRRSRRLVVDAGHAAFSHVIPPPQASPPSPASTREVPAPPGPHPTLALSSGMTFESISV